MRILDKANLAYKVLTYEHKQEAIDGCHVARLLHQDPQRVFKTLVTITNTGAYAIFVIPVNQELDLKKCAKVLQVKNIEMIHVKDIQKITGYVRGGCSPIGMKKQYQTIVHETCMHFDTIMFSGGKIGIQITMSPIALLTLLHADCADLIKEYL